MDESLNCSMEGMEDLIAELRGIVGCWEEVDVRGVADVRGYSRYSKYRGAEGNLARSDWFQALGELLRYVPEAESVAGCECADFGVHKTYGLTCSLNGAMA